MSENSSAERGSAADLSKVFSYHDRSKHSLNAYAAGPETLDWDAQPDPFRRYAGAPLTPLPLAADRLAVSWADLFQPGRVPPQPLSRHSLGLLFELSLALSAWKMLGPDRWAVRVNPSSGNLHPTEGWLLCQGVAGLADGVHHYAPHEHALEHRASLDRSQPDTAPRAWVALSSIAWREAWKYGERAFRYVQLDTGHALGALRYAAAALGWRVQRVGCDTRRLSGLLGLDRDTDFAHAEREEPELLLALQPLPAAAPQTHPATPPAWPAPLRWHGVPNRLDRHPMYRWPVIDAVTQATQVRSMPPPAPEPVFLAPLPSSGAEPSSPWPGHTLAAATLIRQRRSAQRFDARARMSAPQLWALLQALMAPDPSRHPSCPGPLDAWPLPPRVHVLVFPNRVDGVEPGACWLPRRTGWHPLPPGLDLVPEPSAPPDLPLWRLARNPALAAALRTLNCHQALGADATVGFALLAEFDGWPDASAYRDRLQEAGLLGQVLYLQAEAVGLRGTGIGCFFDDATHQMVGLPGSAVAGAALQSVYHFTVGMPVADERIATQAPYAHLKGNPLSDSASESSAPTAPAWQRLQAAQVADWLAAHPGALQLDAREAARHALSHPAGALRLDGRNHEALLLREPKSRPVLIWCEHGNASQTWAAMFTDFRFAQVADVVGGWSALDPQGRLQGPQTPLQLWLAAEGFQSTDPQVPGRHGNTPLMHAAWRGAHAVVHALLAQDVPLDAVNDDGNNALWLACVNGDLDLIRTLAAAGVPVEHANLTGATPLMYAASSGKAQVASTLLELGADPLRQTQDGFSALDMAATLDCLRLLRAASRRVA